MNRKAVAVLALITALAIISLSIAHYVNNSFTQESAVRDMDVAIAGFCGAGDLSNPVVLSDRGGHELTLTRHFERTFVNEDDPDPNDQVLAGSCEITLYAKVLDPLGGTDIQVIFSPGDGREFMTIIQGDQLYDVITSRDFLKARGLDWLTNLPVHDVALRHQFWANYQTGEVTHREYIPQEFYLRILIEEDSLHGFGSANERILTLPDQLANLPGSHSVRVRPTCWSTGHKAGKTIQQCERTVDIWIDNPNTPDILEGTTIIVIHPDFVEAEIGRGWFESGLQLTDAEAVIDQLGLADYVKEMCALTARYSYSVGLYDGKVTPGELTGCSQGER